MTRPDIQTSMIRGPEQPSSPISVSDVWDILSMVMWLRLALLSDSAMTDKALGLYSSSPSASTVTLDYES